MFILEAQRYHAPEDHLENPDLNGIFEHIGYMNKIFKTKQKACEYYDSFNPQMRSLNAHKTWCSDWNPTTYLRYVVRPYSGEDLKFPSFD